MPDALTILVVAFGTELWYHVFMVISERAEIGIYAAIKSICAKPVIVCAWCPGFVPELSIGMSHGMCKSCAAKAYAELDRLEAKI